MQVDANDATNSKSVYSGDVSNVAELKYVESGGCKGQGLYLIFNGTDYHIVTD